MKNNILEKKLTPFYFILPALMVTVIIHYIPIFWGIMISFQGLNLKTFNNYLKVPFVFFDNYINLFKDSESYSTSIKNILVFVIFTIPITYIISLSIALVLNQNFKTRHIFLWVILLPYITPDSVIFKMWRNMFLTYSGIVNQVLLATGLIDKPILWLIGNNQMIPVILSSIWKSVSFGILILLAGLKNIPDEIYEAGMIDGANYIKRFAFITWPLLKPVTYTLLLVSIIWNLYAFNQFYVLLVNVENAAIVPTILIRNTAFFGFNFGIASAMSTLILITVLIFTSVYFYVQKKKEEG